MNLSDVPKFVINLDDRSDRLARVAQQFENLGWTFERFPAIVDKRHFGCTRSHIEVCRLAKDRGYNEYMIFEDDVHLIPDIKEVEKEWNIDFEYDLLHLGPAINSHVQKDRDQYPFIHLNKDVDDSININREVLCAHAMLVKAALYDDILNCKPHEAIDVYFRRVIHKKYNCYAVPVPVATQYPGHSDINDTEDNNHYIIMYNYRRYVDPEITFKKFPVDMCH